MRADRLLGMVLLLQARGGATARVLAAELGVSVRTVYRDLAALSVAGVPIVTESGPGGGCRLMDGYRFPLRGLRPEEAEALLILCVPAVLRELGLEGALTAAHRQIRATAGVVHASVPALVHLDQPRWFGAQQEVPCLRDLARALRLGRQLAFRYASAAPEPGSAPRPGSAPGPGAPPGPEAAPGSRAGSGDGAPRIVGPLGLVNKAGTWYLVAASGPGVSGVSGASSVSGVSGVSGASSVPGVSGSVRVFRADRVSGARVLPEPFERPADFELAGFWARWSGEFEASRPRLPVRLSASPQALAAFGEVFGPAAGPALEAAAPPGEDGWRVVTLSFEHETAAVHRLAGFGAGVEVLDPPSVRARLVATAREILGRYAVTE